MVGESVRPQRPHGERNNETGAPEGVRVFGSALDRAIQKLKARGEDAFEHCFDYLRMCGRAQVRLGCSTQRYEQEKSSVVFARTKTKTKTSNFTMITTFSLFSGPGDKAIAASSPCVSLVITHLSTARHFFVYFFPRLHDVVEYP